MNRIELDEYVQASERLQTTLARLRELRTRSSNVEEDREAIEGIRIANLDLACADDEVDESAIATLAEHSTRIDIANQRLRNIQGKITESEEALQKVLCGDFSPPFQRLYQAWLSFHYQRGRSRIVDLLRPDAAALNSSSVDLLAWASRDVGEAQQLEIYVPSGVSNPLVATFPGSPWTAQRPQTIELIERAVEQCLPQAQSLLDVIDDEPDFEIPSFTPEEPKPEVSTWSPPIVATPQNTLVASADSGLVLANH
jgi:hypothetical protein